MNTSHVCAFVYEDFDNRYMPAAKDPCVISHIDSPLRVLAIKRKKSTITLVDRRGITHLCCLAVFFLT